MGAADCCGKILLVVINVFFGLFGLIFLAVGIFLKVAVDQVIEKVDPLLENLPSIASGVDIPGVTAPTYLSDDDVSPPFDLNSIFAGLAVMFIVLGVMILGIGILGCVGACCTIKVVLIIYAVIVGTLFLVKFILVICLVNNVFEGKMRKYVRKTLEDKFVGIDDLGLESVVWNVMMIKLECCGLDDYSDFDNAKFWEKTREFEISGTTVIETMMTPVACCTMNGEFPSVVPLNETCSRNPTDVFSNWKKGCWSAIKAELNNQDSYLIAAIVIIFMIEVACVVLAILVICRSGSSKTAPV